MLVNFVVVSRLHATFTGHDTTNRNERWILIEQSGMIEKDVS